MSNVIDTGEAFIAIDGNVIERDALHIAERINEYDEKLTLMCLDPDKAGINDAPFLVLEQLPNGTQTVAFEAWELDDRLLERIYNADQRRFDALITIEKMQNAVRKDNERRYKEVQEERKDIMLAAVVNKKSSFTVLNKEGDKVKINDEGPRTVNDAKKSFVVASKRYTPPKSVVSSL